MAKEKTSLKTELKVGWFLMGLNFGLGVVVLSEAKYGLFIMHLAVVILLIIVMRFPKKEEKDG